MKTYKQQSETLAEMVRDFGVTWHNFVSYEVHCRCGETFRVAINTSEFEYCPRCNEGYKVTIEADKSKRVW